MSIQIISTEDGSHSLKNTELDETYHSVHGAIQESQHVFIGEGLDHFRAKGFKEVSIFEVGFGTGLNAFLTWLSSGPIRIDYTAVEPFPIKEEVYSTLNYAELLGHEVQLFQSLHSCEWNIQNKISDEFSLKKIAAKVEDAQLGSETYDLIYFDAFAPSKQPEIWSIQVLDKTVKALKPGGILVTYCARGQFKRDLKALGLVVESLPGPPGKFEMVRARKE